MKKNKNNDSKDSDIQPASFSAEEAEERTIQMLNVYADFVEECLAIPLVKGRKTDISIPATVARGTPI